MAGHLRLGRILCLYDSNHISLAGGTSLCFSEDVGRRFEAYGWHVQWIEDGNDVEGIDRAISAAKEETGRPSLIVPLARGTMKGLRLEVSRFQLKCPRPSRRAFHL